MSKPVKYFAIAGLLIAGALLVYTVFFKDQARPDSLLVSTRPDAAGASAAVTELLLVLRSLQELSIDTAIFNDPAYRSLEDHSVTIDAVPQGRENPFAPL